MIRQGQGANQRATEFTYFDSGAGNGFLRRILDPAQRARSFVVDGVGRVRTEIMESPKQAH